MLELASGTGVHAKLYSEQFPVLTFQPTEADAYMVAQCNDGTSETDKVSWCRKLDVLEEEDWKGIEDIAEKEGKFDLVLMSNALHMIPCE